jgi:hypothetical protein
MEVRGDLQVTAVSTIGFVGPIDGADPLDKRNISRLFRESKHDLSVSSPQPRQYTHYTVPLLILYCYIYVSTYVVNPYYN